jgi:hypothetical protein
VWGFRRHPRRLRHHVVRWEGGFGWGWGRLECPPATASTARPKRPRMPEQNRPKPPPPPMKRRLCYHRMLTHRSFKCAKWFEYLCAWIGAQGGQGDPIEWVSMHRFHHLHTVRGPVNTGLGPLRGIHPGPCRRLGSRLSYWTAPRTVLPAALPLIARGARAAGRAGPRVAGLLGGRRVPGGKQAAFRSHRAVDLVKPPLVNPPRSPPPPVKPPRCHTHTR